MGKLFDKREFLRLFGSAAVAAPTAAIVSKSTSGEKSNRKETAYERMTRTNTLRCGYNLWEPWVMKDPTTGVMSGAFVDFIEMIGTNAGIKIEWTAQLDWGHFPEDLRAGKADAMCAGVWADSRRAKYVAWTDPVWYNQLDAFVREDDNRFAANTLERLNAPDVSIVIWEGTTNEQLANALYPLAKKMVLPVMASVAEGLMCVQNKKADAIFLDRMSGIHFLKNNPGGHVRRLTSPKPVGIYGQTIAVEIHEKELLGFLNTATNEIVNNGIAEQIARRYDPDETSFFVQPVTSSK